MSYYFFSILFLYGIYFCLILSFLAIILYAYSFFVHTKIVWVGIELKTMHVCDACFDQKVHPLGMNFKNIIYIF